MSSLAAIAALAMAPDTSWAVTVSRDGTIRTLGTGVAPTVLQKAVPVDAREPVAVALAGDGVIRVVLAAGDELGLYDNAGANGPGMRTFPVPAPVRALAFSPSCRTALAGCADGTLLSLDTAAREVGRRLVLGIPPAGALAVASDYGPVVVSLRDGGLCRFDLATGNAYVIDT
jgi:hypothetical protein